MFNSNASSADAGGANYIEDVFSTYLYTGTDSAQTINNGIDLAGKGGLVWAKARNLAGNHYWVDTARGRAFGIRSSTTGAQTTSGSTNDVTAFNSNGFSVGVGDQSSINNAGEPTVSWTFRKQPKFFDVVTYTGDGSSSQVIAHNLTSPPGCIIIKATSTTADWVVYARYDEIDPTTPLYKDLRLNTTAASTQNVAIAGATSFTVGGLGDPVNTNGVQYVAYLFAHNAGGFGLTGTDNVISCGSLTTSGTAGLNSVTLGYEPQFVMLKRTDAAQPWITLDIMRGMSNTSYAELYPNNSNAESASSTYSDVVPKATGFDLNTNTGGYPTTSSTYIYIAIRRGPMKVPTDGTKVFTPATWTGTGTATTITSAGFPVDLVIGNSRNAASYGSTGAFGDRLRGKQNLLYSPSTGAEDTTNASITGFDVQNGISVDGATAYSFNYSGGSYVNWFMRRAPGFFDEVCFDEATAPVSALPHNLTVVPELVIYKKRSGTSNWITFSNVDLNKYLRLNTDNALTAGVGWSATSTTINLSQVTSSGTAVAYLFATCAGVSKVGSYTGTATTLQINCGFTAGARFVLIKRTDSTGDWYVWDSARGIVAGNDPYLLLNSTAAEVTSTDYVDTYSAGFELTSTAPAALNASGGTYIFLAIA